MVAVLAALTGIPCVVDSLSKADSAVTLAIDESGIDLSRPWTSPKSATDIISICKSADVEKSEYCDGYIDGATLFWKYLTACNSQAHSDLSFCAGGNAAQNEFQNKSEETLQGCHDCNFRDFGPAGFIPEQLLRQRMQKFSEEMKTAMGVCTPTQDHDTYYCAGYNALVEVAISKYSKGSGEKRRNLGLGDAATDILAYELGSTEGERRIQPCLSQAEDPRLIKNIVLEFGQKDADQQRETSAIMLIAKALYYRLCPAPQKTEPHLEQCTKWDYYDGQFGTKNACDSTVIVQFMTQADQSPIKRQLRSGETFRTGLNEQQIKSGWWMFTTCPFGYENSVPFGSESRRMIGVSAYDCINR